VEEDKENKSTSRGTHQYQWKIHLGHSVSVNMGIFCWCYRLFVGALLLLSSLGNRVQVHASQHPREEDNEYIRTQQCRVKTSFHQQESECLPLFAPGLTKQEEEESVANVCLQYVPQEGAISVQLVAKDGYTVKATQFWAGLDPSKLPMSGRSPDYADFLEVSEALPEVSFLYRLNEKESGCDKEEFSFSVSLRTFVARGMQGQRVKSILTLNPDTPYLVQASVACSCPVGSLLLEPPSAAVQQQGQMELTSGFDVTDTSDVANLDTWAGDGRDLGSLDYLPIGEEEVIDSDDPALRRALTGTNGNSTGDNSTLSPAPSMSPAPTISPAPSTLYEGNGTDERSLTGSGNSTGDDDTAAPSMSPAPTISPAPSTLYEGNGTDAISLTGSGNSTGDDDAAAPSMNPAPTISPAPSTLYEGNGTDARSLTGSGNICIIDDEYSLCYDLQTNHDGTVVGGQVCVELVHSSLVVTITASHDYSLFDSEIWLGFQGIGSVPLSEYGTVDYRSFPYFDTAVGGEAHAQFTIDLQSYCQDGANEHEVAMVCHSLIEALDEDGIADDSQSEYVYGYKNDAPDSVVSNDDDWFGWVDFTFECECSGTADQRGRRLRHLDLQGGRFRQHLRGGG